MLLLHRRMPAAQVSAGITAALAAGAGTADVVAVEARKHAVDTAGAEGAERETAWLALRPRRSAAAVITLPRRDAALPADGQGVRLCKHLTEAEPACAGNLGRIRLDE